METNTTNKHIKLQIIAYCILTASIVANIALLILNRETNVFHFGYEYIVIISLLISAADFLLCLTTKHRYLCGVFIQPIHKQLNEVDTEIVDSEEYEYIFKSFKIIYLSGMLWFTYFLFVCELKHRIWGSIVLIFLIQILSHSIVYPVVRKIRTAKNKELKKAKDEEYKKCQAEQKKQEELGNWHLKV